MLLWRNGRAIATKALRLYNVESGNSACFRFCDHENNKAGGVWGEIFLWIRYGTVTVAYSTTRSGVKNNFTYQSINIAP